MTTSQLSYRRSPVEMFEKWFLTGSASILAVTATLKVIAMLSKPDSLGQTNQIFMVPDVVVYGLATVLEMVAAGVLFLNRNTQIKLWITAYLGAAFCSYRFALETIGGAKPCSCLGGTASWIGMSQNSENVLLWGIAFSMLLVSATLLLLRAKLSRSVV